MANDIWGSGVGLAVAALRQKFREMKRLEVDMISKDQPGFVKTVQESSIIYSNGRAIGIEEGQIQEVTSTSTEKQLRNIMAQVQQATELEKYVRSYENSFGQMGGTNAFIVTANKIATSINTLCSQGGESTANKKAVLEAIKNHTMQINTIAKTLQNLRGSASEELAGQIPQVNQLLTQIADVNKNIAAVDAGSDLSISYQRQRRVMLGQLAEYIQINVEDNANSDFLVYTPNGRVLVEGSLAAKFIYTPPAQIDASQTFGSGVLTLQSVSIDPTNLEVPSTGTDNLPPGDPNYYDRRQEAFIFDVSADFSSAEGGSLSGLMQFLQENSVLFSQELDSYAAGLRDSFNSAHNLSSAIMPRAILQGNSSGYIGGDSLAGSLAINASGTLRVSVINTLNNLSTVSADIDISSANNVDSLCSLITNNSALAGHVTASIVNGSLQIRTTDPSSGIALGSIAELNPPAVAVAGSAAYGFSEFFHLNDVISTPASYWRNGDIAGLASSISVNSSMIANPNYFSIHKLRSDALLGATAQAVSGDPAVGRLLSDLFTRTATNFATSNGGNVSQTLEAFSTNLVKHVANELSTLETEKESETEAYKQLEAIFSQEFGLSDQEIAIISLQISRSQDLYFAFINNYLKMTSMIAEIGK